MSRSLPAASAMSNSVGGDTCTGSHTTCTLSRAISKFLKSVYPNKTWSLLTELLGISERAAKYRMSATRPYTIAELQSLLQSEDGAEILEILMDDSKPEWWKQLLKEIALCKARAHQERARQEVLLVDLAPLEMRSRRQVKRFSDADRRLHERLAEKETAVGLLRPNTDRAVAGAVAQAKAPSGTGRQGRGRR